MAVELKNLIEGCYVCINSIRNLDTVSWDIKTNTPYKVTKIDYDNSMVELDIKNNDRHNFYLEDWELEYLDVIDLGYYTTTDCNVKLKDVTLGILEILAKYYDNIPSELIKELILINKTELIIK